MKFLKRLYISFGYGFNGIFHVLKKEEHLKIHVVISLLVIIAGFCFKISPMEWMIIVLCIGLVISAELMNTAIERLSDIVNPNHNPNIGLVKDIAAGAVIITAIISVIIGMLIFLPKIIDLLTLNMVLNDLQRTI